MAANDTNSAAISPADSPLAGKTIWLKTAASVDKPRVFSTLTILKNSLKNERTVSVKFPASSSSRCFHHFLDIQHPWPMPGEPDFPAVRRVHENFSLPIKRQD